MDERHFDLIVIGTGMTGKTVAERVRAAGWTVAVVDDRPYGGTCALRGCDPKKILVAAAEVEDAVRRLDGNGVLYDGGIEWSDLIRFKDEFVDSVPEKFVESFREQGIETLKGTASFVAEDAIDVDGSVYTADHFVIATGAKPMELGIRGEEHLTTSAEFLDLSSLPDRIAFVGGGYISHEFAHVAARAGAKVRIVEMTGRPLRGFDPDLVDILVEATEALGIEYAIDTRVEEIERGDSGLTMRASSNGAEQSLDVDLVVHGAGRTPRLGPLDLDAGGIERDSKGVHVDSSLRSVSNERVFAGGDAVEAGLPLTPVAVYHGVVIAQNLLGEGANEVDHTGTPAVVFTLPQLARVGMTQEEADASGASYTVNFETTEGWYTSRRINAKHTAYKVLIEDETERILGAHLLGHAAGEPINLFAMAMRNDLTANDLKRTIFSYPTSSHDVRFML